MCCRLHYAAARLLAALLALVSLVAVAAPGPNPVTVALPDGYVALSGHVLPALLRKFHEAAGAPEVTVWGTGSPRREFLHVDDLASAAVFLMKNYESPEILNVGTGEDLTIRELAEMMARVTGFRGALVFDHSKPDGTPRKVLDVSRIHALGWEARIPLEEGIAATYKWYLTHQQQTVSP